MAAVVWEISMAEFESNKTQFMALGPQMGRIDGNTARTVLMNSGLAPQILAQIWALSDLDRDGMLDIREFSIAMRLTRNCLAGAPLPSQLPPSLHQIPFGGVMMSSSAAPMGMMSATAPMNMSTSGFMTSMSSAPMSYGCPVMQQQQPAAVYGSPARPAPPAATSNSSAFPGKQCGNWAVPHQAKLRYCQQFNQLDKQRMGWLSGQAGRNALGMSGLPTPALAHIWGLSDVNKDGRLSVDEFAIAMHFIDMHKAGFALPEVTPPELVQMCGLSRSENNSPQLEPGAPPAQKCAAPRTFEDKRMDNFAKGQAELERRRQILMEEENRRRAEIERREKEEADKRERERLDKERRREAERQAELERQRQLEEARMEEERKREMEREHARREAEKQRMIEAEKNYVKQLQGQKQHEAEQTAQRQQRQKTLGFQLQALDEKAADTDMEITKARERITEITHEIEGMRGGRDSKMQQIAELQAQNQQLSVQAQEVGHQLLQLQGVNKEAAARKAEVEETMRRRDAARSTVEGMKSQLEETRRRSQTQRETADKKKSDAAAARSGVLHAREEYQRLLTLMSQLQIKARAKLSAADAAVEAERLSRESAAAAAAAATAAANQAAAAAASHPAQDVPKTNGTAGTLPLASTAGTIKYRALYEFVARSEDELSFQPGDVILVFEAHAAEPGWRAGQIREKVGWFPEAFAEPIGAVPVNGTASQPIQNMPPNVTPSPSLDRIPEESAVRNAVPVQAQVTSPVESCATGTVICSCIAQFPWKARNDGDLSFSKGDVIEVTIQQEMKWCGRKADGSTGWFPKSYVKVQQTSSSQPSSASQSMDHGTSPAGTPGASAPISRQASIQSAATPQTVVSPSASSQNMTSSVSQQSVKSANQPAVSAVRLPPPSASGEWFVAMFDFEAAEPTDLPLVVGDKIFVTEQVDSWWKGRCNGREGIFPANYVQKSESVPSAEVASAVSLPILCRVRAVADFDATAANQLSLRVGDVVAVREKSDAGWWEGEKDGAADEAAGWFPGDYVVPVEGSNGGAAGEVSATALFDYTASQPDELSFATGDIIIIDSKVDAQWWTGHKADTPSLKGLFPASYVQLSTAPSLYAEPPSLYELPPMEQPAVPALYDQPPGNYESALYEEPPVQMPISEKLEKLIQELVSTEERYLGDLVLAKKLFYQNMLQVVTKKELDCVFLNWDQLIDVSKRMLARMKRAEQPGSLFLSEIASLSAFVTFCQSQQSALEAVPRLLQTQEARALYAQCCASPHARGMTLNYFLMIPLGRVTRYPLLVEKMLKESDPAYSEYQDLDSALQLLRALVAEVNQAVSEMDTVALLCWCQQHIRCPSIQPHLEFTAPTRLLGNRTFLHSSVLYKARSGKLLVAILFNDFLLLCTPDDHIHEAEHFRITKTTEISLTMYKQPYMLSGITIEQSKEGENYILYNYGDDVVHLRCTSRNSAKLWAKELQQAVDSCAIKIAEAETPKRSVVEHRPKGVLLIELMSIQNISLKTIGNPPHLLRVSLNEVSQVFPVELTSSSTQLKLTTQFPFNRYDQTLRVALYQRREYCPDLMALDEASVSLKELVAESSKHRGPIMKPLLLRKGSASSQKKTECVLTKFVVQEFESQI